jgi:paraquat-inducible protein B
VGERAGATLDATSELVKKVDREIEPLAASLRSTLEATRELVSKADRQIEPVAGSLRTTLDAAHGLVGRVDREIEPLAASLRSTLEAMRTAAESAKGALVTVNRALDGDTLLGDELSQALQQLTGAARSLNALADYLQRHPEALLRGKQGSEAR